MRSWESFSGNFFQPNMTPPPIQKTDDGYGKLHKELYGFLIGLGVLLAIAAYIAFSVLNDVPRPLWGVARHLAIGVPLAILAALHLISGVLLATLRNRVFCVIGAISATLLAIFYFVFMFSATGTLPINFLAIVVLAIPILVWARSKKFLSMSAKATK